MSIKELFKKIMYVILVLFVFYLAYELLRKILGGSLGFEEIVIALVVVNIGFSFSLQQSIHKLDKRLSAHLTWHKAKENNTN